MLVYKIGDILKATEDIICHQVNCQGIMGGGLALQIARAYPNIKKEYQSYCTCLVNNYDLLKGDYYIVKAKSNKYIANCFTQKPNFDTDYIAIKECFKGLLNICKETGRTIAIPYGYGCGIANGNWEDVETILRSLSGIYDVDISVYKLEV